MSKKKSSIVLIIFCLFFGFFSFAQNKLEREHRIKKSQFPVEALQVVADQNSDFKRLKYYMSVDSTGKNYTAKFKKARLFYEMDFNEKGDLICLGFSIKPVDIPEESFECITTYLGQNFEKSKVRKMVQVYSIKPNGDKKKTIKNAFQNLMSSEIEYELFVKGKKDGALIDYVISFDSEGKLVRAKKALPSNYDRVLY